MKDLSSGAIAALLCCTLLTPFRSASAAPPVGRGYTLVFRDEFDGTALDATKWSVNYPWGTYHNGRANMQSSQVSVGNGLLTLKAEARRSIWDPWGIWRDDFGWLDLDYTSGAIHSNTKFRVRYGYIEGRFKMPPQVSTWPAFWMLQDGWPPEMDILEVVGDRRRYYYNYHYGPDWQNHQSFGGEYWGPDLSAGWHTYGVEWNENQLRFYFDDQLVRSFTNRSAISQAQAMYLILNLQVGGWAPAPNAADYATPALFQCDWVRVWQAGGPPSGTYRITPRHAPDKAMEVNGWNTANGAKIDLWTYGGGGDNARFRLERQPDGSYKIRTGMTWASRVIDLNSGFTGDGGTVTLWDDNNGDNQRWYFAGGTNGWWAIHPKVAPGKALDGVGSANGSLVQTWGFGGATNQQWMVTSDDPALRRRNSRKREGRQSPR